MMFVFTVLQTLSINKYIKQVKQLIMFVVKQHYQKQVCKSILTRCKTEFSFKVNFPVNIICVSVTFEIIFSTENYIAYIMVEVKL